MRLSLKTRPGRTFLNLKQSHAVTECKPANCQLYAIAEYEFCATSYTL